MRPWQLYKKINQNKLGSPIPTNQTLKDIYQDKIISFFKKIKKNDSSKPR